MVVQNMIQRKQFDIIYKSNRKYLQGPDVFDATLEWLSNIEVEVKDIDFTFHRLAFKQVEAVMDDALPDSANSLAECRYTVSGYSKIVHIVETDLAVTTSRIFPENDIIDAISYDLSAQRSVYNKENNFSNMEIWVAMTKALHQKVFADLKGKWLFVRGRFPQYSLKKSRKKHTVAIAASFGGKLTRSEVFLNDMRVGEIFFSIT